ncbi:MAG: hypothetical protein SW833_19275 [Cyanobacteriota bacterium]|nr:hypothetical protein [Cyanobacteriota bacterium]
MTQTPLRTLGVGTVLRTALQLYRDRFKLYLGIAARANLWLLPPAIAILTFLLFLSEPIDYILVGFAILATTLLALLGLAKFQTNLALISRLAFSLLVNRPETIQEASRQLFSRSGNFLQTFLLTVTIVFAAFVGFAFCFLFLSYGSAFLILIASPNPKEDLVAFAIIFLLFAIFFVAASTLFFRFVMRFSVFEVPLALENNLNAFQSINRSWQLTKGNVNRILFIFLIAVLVTLPVQMIVIILPDIVVQYFLRGSTDASTTSPRMTTIVIFMVNIIRVMSNIFLIPLWQILKSILYFELRRQEEELET